MQNVVIDFSHVYLENVVEQFKNIKRMDMSDICGADMYYTKEAEEEIRNRLRPFGPEGIHFFDNGNYHYATKLFAEKIQVPFSLAPTRKICYIENRKRES